MQQNPLGKASRKLHKSARDRVNKTIRAMLGRPNQKGKPNFCWSDRTQQWCCTGSSVPIRTRPGKENPRAENGNRLHVLDGVPADLALVSALPKVHHRLQEDVPGPIH
jgi:hypothetical protein